MKHLVINRKQWLRGKESSFSYLLRRKDGKMCCLGFYLFGEGFSKDVLVDKETPSQVTDYEGVLVEFPHDICNRTNSPLCNNLIQANDSSYFSEEEREIEIALLFKKIDVEVEFV